VREWLILGPEPPITGEWDFNHRLYPLSSPYIAIPPIVMVCRSKAYVIWDRLDDFRVKEETQDSQGETSAGAGDQTTTTHTTNSYPIPSFGSIPPPPPSLPTELILPLSQMDKEKDGSVDSGSRSDSVNEEGMKDRMEVDGDEVEIEVDIRRDVNGGVVSASPFVPPTQAFMSTPKPNPDSNSNSNPNPSATPNPRIPASISTTSPKPIETSMQDVVPGLEQAETTHTPPSPQEGRAQTKVAGFGLGFGSGTEFGHATPEGKMRAKARMSGEGIGFSWGGASGK
jgi:hypothetical protein